MSKKKTLCSASFLVMIFVRGLFFAVTRLKAANATFSVHHLLFASKKRVAFRTDLNV